MGFSTCSSVQLLIVLILAGNTACMLRFLKPEWYWDTLMKICVFVFAFVVPVLVITICYGLMILRLKSVRLLSGSKEKDRNLRRITRMVLVVVAAFIICWTPIHIFIIVRTMVDINHNNLFVMASWHLCIALGYTNSSLNPVLYAFLDENFKRCFRDFCLPYRARLEQSSFSRARNSTREPASVCAPMGTERPPAWLGMAQFGGRGIQEDLQTEVTQVSTTGVWGCKYTLGFGATALKSYYWSRVRISVMKYSSNRSVRQSVVWIICQRNHNNMNPHKETQHWC